MPLMKEFMEQDMKLRPRLTEMESQLTQTASPWIWITDSGTRQHGVLRH
jgi:hypothetical protein